MERKTRPKVLFLFVKHQYIPAGYSTGAFVFITGIVEIVWFSCCFLTFYLWCYLLIGFCLLQYSVVQCVTLNPDFFMKENKNLYIPSTYGPCLGCSRTRRPSLPRSAESSSKSLTRSLYISIKLEKMHLKVQ